MMRLTILATESTYIYLLINSLYSILKLGANLRQSLKQFIERFRELE
jgi:hypothetical protein